MALISEQATHHFEMLVIQGCKMHKNGVGGHIMALVHAGMGPGWLQFVKLASSSTVVTAAALADLIGILFEACDMTF